MNFLFVCVKNGLKMVLSYIAILHSNPNMSQNHYLRKVLSKKILHLVGTPACHFLIIIMAYGSLVNLLHIPILFSQRRLHQILRPRTWVKKCKSCWNLLRGTVFWKTGIHLFPFRHKLELRFGVFKIWKECVGFIPRLGLSFPCLSQHC